MPELVEEGLVLHDITRHHQAAQDDTRSAAIDQIVVLIAQHCAPGRQLHQGRIRIGPAHHASGNALIAGRERPIGAVIDRLHYIPMLARRRLGLLPEQLDQMVIHHVLQPWDQRIEVGVAGHLGGVTSTSRPQISPTSSHRSSTCSKNWRKTRSPTGGECGSGWNGPAATHPGRSPGTSGYSSDRPPPPSTAAPNEALQEQHQVQLEKDHRIDRGAAAGRVVLLHEVADEREVEGAVQVPVEVVGGHRSSSVTCSTG